MKNLNACLASLNLGLPDDVRRLKEAGYYTEAIACIDTYLAEDWTKTQNQPVQPAGPLPENPTPSVCDALAWLEKELADNPQILQDAAALPGIFHNKNIHAFLEQKHIPAATCGAEDAENQPTHSGRKSHV